ncbi:MAG: PrsW family glutamic-type intramembrane protease [Candidatus Thermoplasmatota archaeon]|nr:PrsW family glutamic-type intramembrane protease [Candidatus Thermoplasmatota archaeon]
MRPVAARPLSPPPVGLVLASPSTPWRTVGRMVGLVILLYLIATPVTFIFVGLLDGDFDLQPGPANPWMSLTGALCSLPLVAFVLFLRRPRLTHVILAEAASGGQHAHQLPGETVLQTPWPTVLRHHLIRRSPPLDLPRPGPLAALFLGAVGVMVFVLVPLGALQAVGAQIILFLLLLIPAWLIGFSIPVFIWWAVSSEVLQLQTDRRQGEAMLIAGMLSTFPALVINSLLFPMGLAAIGITGLAMTEALTVTVSAPVGEEICKFLAVLSLRGMIDSSRRGLQVGFTVGLGFAMLENLQYVLLSLVAEPTTAAFSYGFTSLIRGIGSIPGHAVWTGLSGYALGCVQAKHAHHVEKATSSSATWGLFNAQTGQAFATATSAWVVQRDAWTRRVASSFGPAPPRVLLPALLVGIAGHALWNGSTVVLDAWLVDASAVTQFIAFVGWIFFLVALVLQAGRRLFAAALMDAQTSGGTF